MAEELRNILAELQVIRTYLIKKGKERHKGEIKVNKYKEAIVVINRFYSIENEILILINKGSLSADDISFCNEYISQIKKLFSDISHLCTEPAPQPLSAESIENKFEYTSENISLKMEKFDLKTAVSLLPILDGTESTIKRLIDGIEMYSSLLDSAGQNLLIRFVLKTRLSESAKLRLPSTYTSVNDLVKDMRKHLMTKKSFTSLHSQLIKCSQNSRNLDSFGRELEELFTDLTISQADGNSQNYDVLLPLNEKLAIKRFCDGLSDKRLSTIIAARNYSSLKDAIQAARDEELAGLPSTSSQPTMMPLRRGGRRLGRQSYYRRGVSTRQEGKWYYSHSPGQSYNNKLDGRTNQVRPGRNISYGKRLVKSGNWRKRQVNILNSEDRQDHPEDDKFFRP